MLLKVHAAGLAIDKNKSLEAFRCACWTASASLAHSSCTVHICIIFFGLRSCYAQSHSDDGHVHATAPSSACALAQAHLTVSYRTVFCYHCKNMRIVVTNFSYKYVWDTPYFKHIEAFRGYASWVYSYPNYCKNVLLEASQLLPLGSNIKKTVKGRIYVVYISCISHVNMECLPNRGHLRGIFTCPPKVLTSIQLLNGICLLLYLFQLLLMHLCAHSLITTVEEAPRCKWGDQSQVKTTILFYSDIVTLLFVIQLSLHLWMLIFL